MPRIVDHDAQRHDLLDRSFALFADKGYGGVTMRGLARELGVSTGTLYHYFEGKPDMFGQMLGFLAQRDIADAVATLSPDDGFDERIQTLTRWVSGRTPYLRRLLLLALDGWRLDPSDASRAALTDIARTYREALTERLSLPDPQLGSILFSFLVGSIVHGTLDPSTDDMAPALQIFMGLLPSVR